MATLLENPVREINSKMAISHYIILNHVEPFTIAFALHYHTCTPGPYQPMMTESDPPLFHSSMG